MPERPDPSTLTARWAATYRADLLTRLEWELDAGWRTVTTLGRCPQPVDEPVHGPWHGPPAPARAVVHTWARAHLRVVA